MDIQTFSTTYWYIWFLLILLLILLVIINGIGVLLYRRRRRQFLNKSNKINENIPMCDVSTLSSTSIKKSKYKQMSIPSTTTSDLSFTDARNYRLSFITNTDQTRMSIPNITTIDETLETSQSESISPLYHTKEKSDMDLLLEEFQRQALKEHNSVRAMYNKSPLKLTEALNVYAQYWADQCAQMNRIVPSRPEWRLHCKGQPLGENIVSVRSSNAFDGSYFTSLIMANGNQSYEVNCVLNEISTEVGFGRAQSQPDDDTQQAQWIGVAHYYPYRQLTTVQS